jgi:hypothetical protein
MRIKNSFLAGFVSGVIIVSGFIGAGNCFVKPKETTKKRSASNMKEECIESVVTILTQTPDVIVDIAQMQSASLNIMTSVHEGSWMNNAPKADLERESVLYQQNKECFGHACGQIFQCSKFLTEQEEKYSVKKG